MQNLKWTACYHQKLMLPLSDYIIQLLANDGYVSWICELMRLNMSIYISVCNKIRKLLLPGFCTGPTFDMLYTVPLSALRLTVFQFTFVCKQGKNDSDRTINILK